MGWVLSVNWQPFSPKLTKGNPCEICLTGCVKGFVETERDKELIEAW